jgi:hypothetical protein
MAHIVRTDDAIHRERGQLIAIEDVTLWGILPALRPHYVLLGLFAAVSLAVGGLIHLAGGDKSSMVLWGVGFGFLVQWQVGKHMGKGVTFKGLCQTVWAEIYWWWIARLDSVRDGEARKPGLLLAKSLKRKD